MLNTITYTPVVERSAFTTGQAYDDLHRLLTSSITGAANGDNVGRTYTYSAIGNILSASDQGTYLYESTNYANPHAVTKVGSAVYGYDNNGNLTNDSVWAHQWDYQNKLTQSQKTGSTVTYQYDHSGQRTKYANGTKTIRYANKLYNTDGTTATKHIYAGNQLIGTVEGSTLQYVHTDHLTGSNVATNNAGTMIQLLDYQPYGALRVDWKSGTYDEQRKFTGHEFDRDTALTYANARYYNGGVGRFLSQDPVFLALGNQDAGKLRARLGNPQGLNSYAYSFNNPIRYVDVTGEDGVEFRFKATAFLVSAGSNYLHSKAESLKQGGHNVLGSVLESTANKLDTYATAVDPASSQEDRTEALQSLAGDLYMVAGFVEAVPGGGSGPWKVGDPINTPTKNGYPSWSTARERYWKNEAAGNPGNYKLEQLERMKNGLAPKTQAGETIELHHKGGRDIPDPHNVQNLQPVTPEQHSQVDPYRHLKKN